ncbi:hypothetical protein [Seonamhaeicola aphaedonensis]|uniref:DNA primase n=1 Tax=Seonamhaeicola aphaedonensis TaxID=1461338 RepID=A0A3D9H907_9FLAO|nr:hypothetical protein [Seonamhaeicola aphaedonensis]RED45982.1 hypothetical protein DFQ02_107130 [Seonamhaeicola aphaedonensis]
MKNRNDNLKRVIVDFKKLTPEILALLVEKYPDGYDDDQIISFRNQHNEVIEAVEVITADTKYLVKVGVKLVKAMEDFSDDDLDSDDDNDSNDDSNVEDIELLDGEEDIE